MLGGVVGQLRKTDLMRRSRRKCRSKVLNVERGGGYGDGEDCR